VGARAVEFRVDEGKPEKQVNPTEAEAHQDLVEFIADSNIPILVIFIVDDAH
jgi:hypothetical protein